MGAGNEAHGGCRLLVIFYGTARQAALPVHVRTKSRSMGVGVQAQLRHDGC
jgi:hypothetical protein